jgi:hypothetical protein
MLHVLKRHFRNELECYLFWLGGYITLAWTFIFIMESYGKNVAERTLSGEDTILYIGSLGFVLGIKGIRKRLNHDNRADDQYLGEIWVIPLLIAAFGILVDYHVLGFATTKPAQMYQSVFGVIGLFGITKTAAIWNFVKTRMPFFKNRPAR